MIDSGNAQYLEAESADHVHGSYYGLMCGARISANQHRLIAIIACDFRDGGAQGISTVIDQLLFVDAITAIGIDADLQLHFGRFAVGLHAGVRQADVDAAFSDKTGGQHEKY